MQPLHYYLAALKDQLHEFYGDSGGPVRGATGDSRKVDEDYIFVAIRGARFDGAEFAPDAVRAGAHTVVAEQLLELPEGTNQVIVKNAYKAASRIAEAVAGYPARAMKLVGITGTNGKTTCAYLMRDILTAAGVNTGMIGTIQYQIGDELIPAERTTPTPFELQEVLEKMREAAVDIVVTEVSSHALHQRRPGTAKFTGALFTNLTGDHCDYHITMDNYFAAKQTLFTEYLRGDAPAVINIDDQYGRQLADNLHSAGHGQIITYGQAHDADWQIQKKTAGLDGVRVRIRGPEATWMDYQSPVAGGFNIYNITGTVVLAKYLGVSEEALSEAVSNFRGAPGRMEPIEIKAGIKAFVDYAHTDDALANVLEAVCALKPRRILLVFGCGGDRDRTKRPRMGSVAAQYADKLYVTSDNPRGENPDAIIKEIIEGIPDTSDKMVITDRRKAILQAVADAGEGDVVLVTGKGHETYQEVKGEKYPFDDREILRSARCHAKRGSDPHAWV
ncbi:MAG: UDP-N-acetylmuramoyl-L-alanyl-D-glutamate--2,6-diaminopimelate ligase [Lentisphaeria bacterium]